MMDSNGTHFDVVIVGGGLAGLSLARQLLLYTDKTVLLVDKQAQLPARHQKVGESLVQLAGYYFSKVLQLEEHLMLEHYLKYNLRFQWKTPGLPADDLANYSKSFIRLGSNIATFQLDRNVLEAHLLALNSADCRFRAITGVLPGEPEISPQGRHQLRVGDLEITCRWLVDASGRGRYLKRAFRLDKQNSIRHGATWCWVDGLVNIEKLTSRSATEVRLSRTRMKEGQFPQYLATNHFCDEGQWFWVIPLRGKTSLGLVYDHAVLAPERVANARKMLDYVCENWPLLKRDLPQRKVLDEGRLVDFSYDCQQTISAERWALVGEAGRFSDPLYSPGSDLIAIYNTLVVDCIQTEDQAALEAKTAFYEQIERAVYAAYVPSYDISYNCLGDQEAFTLKYSWELAIYFSFYVLPVINDMFTNIELMRFHLKRFALLGAINHNIQQLLAAFCEWKKREGRKLLSPHLNDFYEMRPLRVAEKLFYKVGLGGDEARQAIEMQFESMKEFARYIIAHVYASVLGDKNVLTNGAFLRGLRLNQAKFDPAAMREQYAPFAGQTEEYLWKLNPHALETFIRKEQAVAAD